MIQDPYFKKTQLFSSIQYWQCQMLWDLRTDICQSFNFHRLDLSLHFIFLDKCSIAAFMGIMCTRVNVFGEEKFIIRTHDWLSFVPLSILRCREEQNLVGSDNDNSFEFNHLKTNTNSKRLITFIPLLVILHYRTDMDLITQWDFCCVMSALRVIF